MRKPSESDAWSSEKTDFRVGLNGGPSQMLKELSSFEGIPKANNDEGTHEGEWRRL